MKSTALLALILLSVAGLSGAGGDDQKPFELTTLLGESFHHCRIIKATPEGITVSHDDGVSKIPFENLSDEWKTRFHYSPDKASAFQKDEAMRRTAAEEKRRQMQKDYEENRAKQLSERVAAESRRLNKLEEDIARQQAAAAAVAAAAVASQPGMLVPFPGDPVLYPGAGVMSSRSSAVGTTGATVQSTTEVLIPATAPIGQIYTPNADGSQHYIINQGAVFTPGDGSIYSVYPGYGYGNSGYVNPPIVIYPPGTAKPCLPVTPVPHGTLTPGANIKVGPGVIHLGR